MADGTPLGIEGRATLGLKWGERDFSQDLVVAKLGDNHAILGLDFIEKHRAVLYLADGRMEIGSIQITLRKEGQNPGCAKITTKTSVTIADQSSAWLNVELDPELVATREIRRDGYCVVEGLDTLANDYGLYMANQLVKVSGSTVKIHVLNVHDQPVKVREGTSLGTVFPVHDYEKLKDPSLSSASSPAESKPSMQPDLSGTSDNPGEGPVHQLGQVRAGGSDKLLTRHDLPEHTRAVLNDTTELTAEQEAEVCQLVLDYSDTFKAPGGPNGRTDWEEHGMDMQGARPVKQGYRPFPRAKQEVADAEVDKMLADKIIEPSHSPWASPVVLVTKKDGSIRFCVDYRKVNELTKKDAYPLPRISETLDTLSGGEWFCTMDLASGYWQIKMSDYAKPMTAFTTRKGLFHFNVMPFGLSNAPATFQRLMERVLMGLQWQICLCYLDDIIVFGATFDITMSRLKSVMEQLRAAGLKLKAAKCAWFQREVKYLGHIVSGQGIQCDPEKIAAVKEWPTPATVTQVRGFLGFASYYRKFIPHFSEIAFPLTNLTRKHARFEWSEDCQGAFETLKQQLITAPVLSYPAREGKYILDTDASDFAIGAVLSQIQDGEERVIAYASRVLGPAKQNYCTTKKELLAVVVFVDHFKHYLSGVPFTVRTDHASLKWLRNFKNAEGMLARWLSNLECYDFEIIHRRGTQHGNADGMSRIPITNITRKCPRPECADCTRQIRPVSAINTDSAQPQGEASENWLEAWTQDQLKDWQRADPTLGQVIQWLEHSPQKPAWREVETGSIPLKYYWSTYDAFLIEDGVLKRTYHPQQGRQPPVKQIVAPDKIRQRILQSLHGSPTGAHVGRNKLIDRVRQRFFWVGYQGDISRWCKRCDLCAQAKTGPPRKRAALRQRPVGVPLERMAVDIMGPLPVTESGNEYIMVVGDYYSKWTEAYALKNHTAHTVAENLVERFISRFGVPRELHSDQGREFESNLVKALCDLLHIRKTRTVPYNPKSDGMIERFNRTVKSLLTVLVNDAQNDWDDHLPFIMMAYRASQHESTKCTPNLLMLNKEVNLPVDLMLGSPPESPRCPVEYVEWVRQATQNAFRMAESNLKASAHRQKRLYDKNSGAPRLEVGDSVWRLYPPTAKQKFGKSWQGPFLVTGKINDLVYTIQKAATSRSVNVHVDHLKKYEGINPVNNWLHDVVSDSDSESEEEEMGDDPSRSTEDLNAEPLDAPSSITGVTGPANILEQDPTLTNWSPQSPQPGPSHSRPPNSIQDVQSELAQQNDSDTSLDSTLPYTYDMYDNVSPTGHPPSPANLPVSLTPTTVRRTARPRKPKHDPVYDYY